MVLMTSRWQKLPNIIKENMGDNILFIDADIIFNDNKKDFVKNINLSKTDSTGLAEVRFEQDGFDGLKQLRVLYDTTIKTYLDVGAFPGSYIYVDPRGFDPSGRFDDIGLDELGIGGYCMLWKTEHVIQPGLAESTLHAKWVASKGDSRDLVELEEQETTQKCAGTMRAD